MPAELKNQFGPKFDPNVLGNSIRPAKGLERLTSHAEVARAWLVLLRSNLEAERVGEIERRAIRDTRLGNRSVWFHRDSDQMHLLAHVLQIQLDSPVDLGRDLMCVPNPRIE